MENNHRDFALLILLSLILPNDKSQTIEHNNFKGGGTALLHHLDCSKQYSSLTPNHPKYASDIWRRVVPLTICCAQVHNRLPSSSAFFLLERVPACQLNLRHTYPTSDKQKEWKFTRDVTTTTTTTTTGQRYAPPIFTR